MLVRMELQRGQASVTRELIGQIPKLKLSSRVARFKAKLVNIGIIGEKTAEEKADEEVDRLLAEAGMSDSQPPTPSTETKGEWITDLTNRCRVWNPAPQPQESIKYSGNCPNGTANGHGELQWIVNGALHSQYKGSFRDGRLHGTGVYTYSDGDRYEGEYKDGKKHGRGIYMYSDGGRYEGEFKNGDFNGRGILTYADGGRYEGEFKDDKRHGQGLMVYADGTTYEGEFDNDEPVEINTRREAMQAARIAFDIKEIQQRQATRDRCRKADEGLRRHCCQIYQNVVKQYDSCREARMRNCSDIYDTGKAWREVQGCYRNLRAAECREWDIDGYCSSS